MRTKASDLLIETRNASGTFGVALPLEIKLVRVRNVYIEAIKLLGLPRGATINDSCNTFSSSSDNNDVDVSAWDLSKIQITQSDQRESSFSLAVAAIWTPESGGHIDVTSSRLTVNFAAEHRLRIGAADEHAEPEWHALPMRSEALASQAIALQTGEGAVPVLAPAAPESTAAITRPAPSRAPGPRPDGAVEEAHLPPASAPAQSSTGPDPLVQRAKGLIRLGDISGARLLLERAQSRNAPNATFLLAQTWDPEMHRAWKVRGLRSDPDRARNLYAKAADQGRTDERQLAATGR
ncbi:hypothetical protein ACLBXJ_02620 [Methylobacterium mesophilicum]